MIQSKWAHVLTFAIIAGLTVGGLRYLTNEVDRQNQPAPSTKKDISGVYLQRSGEPMAARFRLEIHFDGKWAMANMLSGWWGTWQWKDGAYYLKSTVSPSGPVEKPKEEVIGYDGFDMITANGLTFDRLRNAVYEIPMNAISK